MELKTACGSPINTIKTEYLGKIIYFCEEDCLDEFLDDPKKFIESDHFLITFDVLEDVS